MRSSAKKKAGSTSVNNDVAIYEENEDVLPTIYSPAITAEMMGLSLYGRNETTFTQNEGKLRNNEIPRMSARTPKPFKISDMMPSPPIMKALMIFIPKAMALGKPGVLDASLVPKDSKIRHLFEEEESDTVRTHHRQ